jgi:hypothetical protein
LEGIPLSVCHHRHSPKIDLEGMGNEYLRDVLGAVALRFFEDSAMAWQRYDAHRQHLARLDGLCMELCDRSSMGLAHSLSTAVIGLRVRLEGWDRGAMEDALRLLESRRRHFLNGITPHQLPSNPESGRRGKL